MWEQWLPPKDPNYCGPCSMESPVVQDGKAFAGGSSCLFCADLRDGSLVWKHEGSDVSLGNSWTSAYHGLAYSVATTGDLYCIQVNNGRVLWRRELAVMGGPPVVADGRVLVGSECFHWRSGLPLWKLSDNECIEGVVGKTGIGFSCQGGSYAESRGMVFAVDLLSGQILWRKATGKGGTAAKIMGLSPDRVVCLTYSNRLMCLTTDRGEEMWALGLQAEPVDAIIVPSGILVADETGLSLRNPSSGTEHMRVTIPGRVTRDILADGRLVVMRLDDGTVRGFDSSHDLGLWAAQGGGQSRGGFNRLDWDDTVCPDCGGDGICAVCGGKGHQRKLFRKITCSLCSGHSYCLRCAGSGTVLAPTASQR